MALNNSAPVTSWGSIHLFAGDTGANDTMGVSLEDLGSINQDAITIETTDGKVYKLNDVNGKLLDELNGEPELKIKFTLLKPSEATRGKFWKVEEVGSGESRKIRVKSLKNDKKFSFKLANIELVGSETIEAPLTKITMKPNYKVGEGYSCDCSLTLLNGAAGYLFDFGVVPNSDALVVTPASLSFTAAADATGKTITATSTNNIVATANGSYWMQVTYTGKVATVKVPANPNTEARTGIVTITADGKTVDVQVTQAGA